MIIANSAPPSPPLTPSEKNSELNSNMKYYLSPTAPLRWRDYSDRFNPLNPNTEDPTNDNELDHRIARSPTNMKPMFEITVIADDKDTSKPQETTKKKRKGNSKNNNTKKIKSQQEIIAQEIVWEDCSNQFYHHSAASTIPTNPTIFTSYHLNQNRYAESISTSTIHNFCASPAYLSRVTQPQPLSQHYYEEENWSNIKLPPLHIPSSDE